MEILNNIPPVKLSFYSYLAFLLSLLITLLELARLRRFWYSVGYNIVGVAAFVFVSVVVKGPWATFLGIFVSLLIIIVLGWTGIEKRILDVDQKKGLTIGRFTLPYETARLWILMVFFYFVGIEGRF